MKTALVTTTTFAIALMVFAFNAGPVMAGGEGIDEYKCQGPTDPHCHPDIITELEEPEEDEQDVADSEDEGSASEAGATEQ
ncbi:MAG: hypothetical protein OXF09_04825 [Hyphomicrobiales bacterium]|nr:hypothetical protein [Hyphomicrobiales bacterium]